MTTKTVNLSLNPQEKTSQMKWVRPLGLFIVFLMCEAAVFILGSNYFKVFPTNQNLTYNLAVGGVFLAAALWLRRTKRWNTAWPVMYAFFAASLAYPITLLFDGWITRLLESLSLTVETSPGMALEKVCEVILIVVPILAAVKLSGSDLGSVYMRRGNLKMGIGVGALVLLFLATAGFMFGAQRFTSLNTLSMAVVWGAVFSISNGFMEELWLRGLFLKRFEPYLGMNGSVLLTSITFALLHGFAFYFTPAALPFFVLNTLALGLACGYLTMKSESIWGAVLIHTASDYFLFIAVLANA